MSVAVGDGTREAFKTQQNFNLNSPQEAEK